MNLELLDAIIRTHHYKASDVIAMLQDLQKKKKYLPESELRILAERVGIPTSRIYSLATFYKSFSLKPRGKHLVNVCLGTACHVRGGGLIMDKLLRDLNTIPGNVTHDGKFTIEPVRCVGCCGLAPVVVIDESFYGKMTQMKTTKILKKYNK